ncbi:MAG: glycosyltransferase family 39 protein [Desulfovibrionaceae bacterium]|nr:glycosyltransferase family 39 protein [Desulfovibrionaceae bacterium]
MPDTTKNRFGSLLDAAFDAGAFWPLVSLAVIVGLQTAFTLDCRQLWYSDEVRYANVLEQLLHKGKWIVLHLNGEPYPDKPPVYFWMLAGLKLIVGHVRPMLFFLGSAVSGYLYAAATYVLARSVAGMDRKRGFAAGLVLASTFYFVGVSHYTRMDLLFAALITFAHVCLFRGWQRDKATGTIVAGFLLAALATLTKGPLGFAFPVVASVAYLCWIGRPQRLFRRDVLLGLLLAVAVLGAWVAAAYFTEPESFLRNIFHDQIYKRAVDTWHHGHPFYHYFLTLPLAWLPWTLLLFLLPWRRLGKGSLWRGAWSARRDEPGLTYVWIALVTGFAMLSAVSIKIVIYLLPLFAPLAVLTARTLLADRRARPDAPGTADRFWKLLAALFALMALAVPFANYAHPWPITITGLIPLAGGCAVLALVFWKGVPRGAARGGLLLLALCVGGWIWLVGTRVAPSLDAVMSPRHQATVMREYIAKGFYPVTYKVYSGTYSYYAGQDVLEVKSWEDVAQVLQWRPKVVLAMKRKYWEEWENRPADLRIVDEQWIVEEPYVLAVSTEAPAPQGPDAPASEAAAPTGPAANATRPADTDATAVNATTATNATPAQ